jgi:hypothetical protein
MASTVGFAHAGRVAVEGTSVEALSSDPGRRDSNRRANLTVIQKSGSAPSGEAGRSRLDALPHETLRMFTTISVGGLAPFPRWEVCPCCIAKL